MAFAIGWMDAKLSIGESPYWDHVTQRLYLVDVNKSTVISYDPRGDKTHRAIVGGALKPVSFIIPVANEEALFLISYGCYLATVNWDGVSERVTNLKLFASIPDLTPTMRFSAAKCDPNGILLAAWYKTVIHIANGTVFHVPSPIFWSVYKLGCSFRKWYKNACTIPDLYNFGLGSMEVDVIPHLEAIGRGVLYAFRKNKIETLVHTLLFSNGIAWSLDGKLLYFIDSYMYRVDCYDYDAEDLLLSNRRTVFGFRYNEVPGLPSGMTIDKDGNLWVALFYSGRVVQIDPVAEVLIRTIQLPTTQINSVTFGGPNLDELYVTSSEIGLFKDDDDLIAGSLFRISQTITNGIPAIHAKIPYDSYIENSDFCFNK